MARKKRTAILNAATSVPNMGEFHPTWYSLSKQDDSEAEMMIYDEIGAFGITASQFVKDLKAIKSKKISLRLNTPGGEVFGATAIYNALEDHPAEVVAHIDGVAASAGSFIAMSADEVRMAENAYLMIHEARGGAFGEASDLQNVADTLEKMNDNIAGMYEAKTGKKKPYWRKMMNDETWFTAAEAKAEGLVDVVDGPVQKFEAPKAAFDYTIYNKIPEQVKTIWGINKTETQPTTPEPSVVTEAPAVSTKESLPMASESTQAPPATSPAAANHGVTQDSPQQQIEKFNASTAQSFIEKGRAQGFAEGKKFAEDRMRAIVAAAPGRYDIAVNAFLAGQNAETVTLINSAAAQAEAKAHEKISQMEVENARLQALAATGGYAYGVSMQPSHSSQQEIPQGLEPQAQAELEWDGDPILRAKNNNNKKAFLLYRVNQLNGLINVWAPKSVA